MAVAGFVLVVAGQNPDGPDTTTHYGWYANPPGEATTKTEDANRAYSSTLDVEFDDTSSVGSLTITGIGLVALSLLITAGVIGGWAMTRPRPSP